MSKKLFNKAKPRPFLIVIDASGKWTASKNSKNSGYRILPAEPDIISMNKLLLILFALIQFYRNTRSGEYAIIIKIGTQLNISENRQI